MNSFLSFKILKQFLFYLSIYLFFRAISSKAEIHMNFLHCAVFLLCSTCITSKFVALPSQPLYTVPLPKRNKSSLEVTNIQCLPILCLMIEGTVETCRACFSACKE